MAVELFSAEKASPGTGYINTQQKLRFFAFKRAGSIFT